MITLRPGSPAHSLLLLLVAGIEFPAHSLHLLGSRLYFEKIVYRLGFSHSFRTEEGNYLGTFRLLNASGRREMRTIRLHRTALPILQALHPAALTYYLAMSNNHKFSGSEAHIQRNHRVAESLAMCLSAGVEFMPYALPPLQKQQICQVVPDTPSFYIARDIKQLDQAELNKTSFTRLTGALFSPGYCYAVYNTRSAVMRWNGLGEFKTARHLEELARMNAPGVRTDHALLLGERMDIALNTLLESDKSKHMDLRFDRIYPHIHYIPMTSQGVRMLKLLLRPNWEEQILSAVFPADWRLTLPSNLECDARRDNTFILSHLDGNIARLVRLRQALDYSPLPFEILCFPWQTALLHEYLGSRVELRELTIDALENYLHAGDLQRETEEGGLPS